MSIQMTSLGQESTIPATTVQPCLADLPTVSLAVLQHSADLQVRHDRKYLLTSETIAAVIGARRHELCVLDIDGTQAFAYESVYFDTPALDSYRSSAHGQIGRAHV